MMYSSFLMHAARCAFKILETNGCQQIREKWQIQAGQSFCLGETSEMKHMGIGKSSGENVCN